MVDLTEIETPKVFTIWGHPGTGKTTLISTFPKPILLLDIAENGSESAKSADLKSGDITVIPISEFEEMEEALEIAIEDGYKTVVIDNMTGNQAQCHEKVKSDENKSKMTQPMFGIASQLQKKLIMGYKSLTDEGIIPVFICHSRTDEVDTEMDEAIASIGPQMTPAISQFLCGTSQIVGQTYIKEVTEIIKGKRHTHMEYCLRVGPNPHFVTKIQKPKDAECPEYIPNPTYDKIMAIVKGKAVTKEVKGTKKKKKK
ncbi:MAG: AAA family ATPase [Fusobacteriaceae bacterium]